MSAEVIQEVWASNLENAMDRISSLCGDYTFVTIDTEFPGVVLQKMPHVYFPDEGYRYVRHNVDILKVIQIGITLTDGEGRTPQGISTWQFNFQFDIDRDTYAKDSIELLTNHGINFEEHKRNGIDHAKFAELLITSGLVLLPEMTWLSFHGQYDFGYLLKLVMNSPLPEFESVYFRQLRLYFHNFYDLKVIIRHGNKYHGGLQKIAEQIGVERVGTSHQAGSDSLLTANVFFKLIKDEHNGVIGEEFNGQLFGLNRMFWLKQK